MNKEELLLIIEKLKKENKELKDLCKRYEKEHNTTFKEWLRVIKQKEDK